MALDEESGEPFSSVIIDGKLHAFLQDTAEQYFATFLSDEAVAEMTAALSKLWPGFKSHVRETYLYSHHPAAVAVWPPGRSPLDVKAQALFEPEDWPLFRRRLVGERPLRRRGGARLAPLTLWLPNIWPRAQIEQ
ncbi:MAG: hypothetical protein ACREVZ_01775 [Burkholderiales bacterium]